MRYLNAINVSYTQKEDSTAKKVDSTDFMQRAKTPRIWETNWFIEGHRKER